MTKPETTLVRWPAPAKINWFLQIVGKRKDGYHLLQTVFQFLDYGDSMTFEVNNHARIERSYDYGFDSEQDLCLRAARLLQEHAAPGSGITIGLEKNLPMGGGLGGGSSDAATTLIALNKLWNIGLSRERLAKIGLQLGADVPVFVIGKAAWAEGVGEQLTPINLEQPWFLVVNPNVHVSTMEIFSHNHLTARVEMKKIRALENGIDTDFGDNQLEPIVRAQYPEVEKVFEWLKPVGNPRMSGSGGSVFMPLDCQQSGLQLLNQLPPQTTGFVAKGINRHPLYDEFGV